MAGGMKETSAAHMHHHKQQDADSDARYTDTLTIVVHCGEHITKPHVACVNTCRISSVTTVLYLGRSTPR